MKQTTKSQLRKIAVSVISLGSIFTFSSSGAATDFGDKEIYEQFRVSPGAYYENDRYSKGSLKQAVNVMKVDLTDPHTDLKLNIPDPLNKLKTTSSQALDNHTNEARVIGAMNASFYETQGSFSGFPANLLLENGKIHRFGRNSADESGFNFKNQSFGMMPDGTAIIDVHTPEVNLKLNGTTHEISGVDPNGRQLDQMVMFTPNYYQDRPGASESRYATEIVVRELDQDMRELSFGQQITGKVTERNTYGDYVNQKIPEDGFVLSANGGVWAEKLENVNVGDELTISLDIEDKWKQANFVIGSGPYLVKNGQRYITMDESSFQARERAPRTAVGISADGKDVFLVTADGRQSGYANGMTIIELADFMIQLGADRAMNLDGGGSTTMAVQKQGFGFPSLANRPSDGRERGVSTTLQVVDRSPLPTVEGSAVRLDDMNDVSKWSTSSVRAESSLEATPQTNAPKRQGEPGIQLNYDFTTSNGGTAASYMKPKIPFLLHDQPKQIGMWVYGDGNEHWLRGNIYDTSGNSYTVDFTKDGGLDWRGWRYVRADLPGEISGPITFEQLYVVEPDSGKHDEGSIIIDQIEAIYDSSYHVDRFTDLTSNHWAYSSIIKLNDRHVITGHTDGSFQPNGDITREQAATMLVRELDLDTDNRPGLEYDDVDKERPLYEMIAAVVDEGLLIGFQDGKFHPGESLTRAELAIILTRAYRLSGNADVMFSDLKDNHWAFESIEYLVANEITGGYPDGTFKPDQAVTRAEFSTFMDRTTN